MAHESAEPPAEEYEQQLAEQRAEASKSIARWTGSSIGCHVAGPAIAICYALLTGAGDFGRRSSILATVVNFSAGILILASLVLGAAAVAATIRHWPLLTLERRVRGFAPWLLYATETAAVLYFM